MSSFASIMQNSSSLILFSFSFTADSMSINCFIIARHGYLDRSVFSKIAKHMEQFVEKKLYITLAKYKKTKWNL